MLSLIGHFPSVAQDFLNVSLKIARLNPDDTALGIAALFIRFDGESGETARRSCFTE